MDNLTKQAAKWITTYCQHHETRLKQVIEADKQELINLRNKLSYYNHGEIQTAISARVLTMHEHQGALHQILALAFCC